MLPVGPGVVVGAEYLLGDDQNTDYVQHAERQFHQGLAADGQHVFGSVPSCDVSSVMPSGCTILTGGLPCNRHASWCDCRR